MFTFNIFRFLTTPHSLNISIGKKTLKVLTKAHATPTNEMSIHTELGENNFQELSAKSQTGTTHEQNSLTIYQFLTYFQTRSFSCTY